MHLEVIEKQDDWAKRFSRWPVNDGLVRYPWVENVHAPLKPMRRALPLLNLALISTAGGHIEGTEGFDLSERDGDLGYREVPVEVEAVDVRYDAKGYDPKHINEDRNCQVPIERLTEYQNNAVIGHLNDVWWSLSSHIPNAARVADELAPALAERLHRYDVQAALLIPASRLCHQTVGVLARVIEKAGIPTMCISVDTSITDRVRPPRTAYYHGELGMVGGKPNWREYQLRVLDECLRWLETFDQPGSRKLAVDLETQTEAARGER